MSDDHGNTGKLNAAKRRAHAQEALRVKIQGEKHIDTLVSIQEQAREMRETIDDEGKRTKPDTSALRLQADISLALLKKVLPDLRHVELSNDDDSPLVVKLVKYGA